MGKLCGADHGGEARNKTGIDWEKKMAKDIRKVGRSGRLWIQGNSEGPRPEAKGRNPISKSVLQRRGWGRRASQK